MTTWFFAHDKKQYAVFKTLVDTGDRQVMLRRWVLESFFLYGVTSIACLALTGYFNALFKMPDALAGLSEPIRLLANSDEGSGFWSGVLGGFVMVLIPGLLFGHTIFALLRTWGAHKNPVPATSNPTLKMRDINALLPRNSAERFWTTILSMNAGLSEELFFRMLAPILFWVVTGNALLAVIAATVWFGLGHFYQGWGGILLTFFCGALFMFIYLYTGNIWLVILIHAIVDLNDLSLSPWFAEWLSKRSAVATPMDGD